MKKLFSIVACLVLACTSLAFVGCGNNGNNRIHLTPNWPDKFYIVYDEYDNGTIVHPENKVTYAKDGNDHYVHYQNQTYGYAYKDIFVRHGSDDYKSALWNGTSWEIATGSLNDQYEQYYRIPAQGSKYMSKGYIDVDLYGEKLENETVVVDGKNVDCVVYTVSRDNTTFWYEANSNILIQYKENDELKMKACKFDTTLTMSQSLSLQGIDSLPSFE